MSELVAVTGATGFVGSHLVHRLAESGYRIRILARRMPMAALTPGQALEVVLGDLDDPAALRRLATGADAFIHVAGIIKARHPAEFEAANVQGSRNVAAALTAAAPEARVIHVSSLAAREPGLSAYAASKRAGEDAMAEVAGRKRLAILRPPAVYGPGDTELFPLFKAASLGLCAYPAAPGARLSLIHGADLAAAIVAAIAAVLPEPVYELDDGHRPGYSWPEIGAALVAATGRPVRMVRVPRPILTAIAAGVEGHRRIAGSLTALCLAKVPELYHRDWVAHGPRLEDHLRDREAWRPRFGLTAGFADTLAWYRARGWIR